MKPEARILGSAAGAIGAAPTAAAAGLCCVGPVVVSVLGVSGAVFAARLGPYRPFLLLGSLLLLGCALWLAYRPPRGPGSACPVQSGRPTRLVLALAAATWVLALVVPMLAAR